MTEEERIDEAAELCAKFQDFYEDLRKKYSKADWEGEEYNLGIKDWFCEGISDYLELDPD